MSEAHLVAQRRRRRQGEDSFSLAPISSRSVHAEGHASPFRCRRRSSGRAWRSLPRARKGGPCRPRGLLDALSVISVISSTGETALPRSAAARPPDRGPYEFARGFCRSFSAAAIPSSRPTKTPHQYLFRQKGREQKDRYDAVDMDRRRCVSGQVRGDTSRCSMTSSTPMAARSPGRPAQAEKTGTGREARRRRQSGAGPKCAWPLLGPNLAGIEQRPSDRSNSKSWQA